MTSGRTTFLVALSFFGLAALSMPVRSFAEQKDAAKDVKFACSQHGPDDMQLTLSQESGKPRKIEFIGGNSTAHWFVKIDGVDITDQTPNQSTVKVRTGDEITWALEKGTHGVAFAEKGLAQALLDFDQKDSQPLVDLNGVLTTNAWKRFGSDRWGVKPVTFVNKAVVLVKCTVK